MSRESRVSEHFTVQHSAIKMLSSRLAIIRDYVQAVESGKAIIFNPIPRFETLRRKLSFNIGILVLLGVDEQYYLKAGKKNVVLRKQVLRGQTESI